MSQCCRRGYTCYEKDSRYAQCRPTGRCSPGIHEDDPLPTHWSCCVLPGDCPVDPGCSGTWGECTESRCCSTGYTCYGMNSTYAMCRPTGHCTPGMHEHDVVKPPWSCRVLTPTAAPGPCLDKHSHCAGWAQIGECQKNPAFMLSSCALSCGACELSTTAPPTSTPPTTTPPSTTTPAPTTTVRVPCLDKNVHCRHWASIGECHRNPSYMSFSCALSCGVCS